MPFVLSLDVVVNFDKFRNVDLLSQGIYCIGVSIMTQKEDIHGIPVSLQHSSVHGREGQYTLRVDTRHRPEELSRTERKAFTHSFTVQFLEQVELLNEVVTFRLEGEAIRLLREDTLHARLELFHLPRDQLDKLPMSHALVRGPLLETRIIPLYGCGGGLHVYVPVAFNDCNFGVVSCSFHTCITGIAFEQAPDPASPSGKRRPGQFEQYVEHAAGRTGISVNEGALTLFHALVSYAVHCFYDLRALVAEFTPQADVDVLEEPDWLCSRGAGPAHPLHDGAPRNPRCRIVSGVDHQEVLVPMRDSIDVSKVFDTPTGPTALHGGDGPISHQVSQGSVDHPDGSPSHTPPPQRPTNDRSSPLFFGGTSSPERPRSPTSPVAEPNPQNFASSSAVQFCDLLRTASRQDPPGTALLRPSYVRPRRELAYAGDPKDMQLYPFGDKTVSTVTEWLVDDLTLEVNEAPLAQLPLLLRERLMFICGHVLGVWHQFMDRTMASPASLFVGLVKVFFRAQHALALRVLSPDPTLPALPISSSTYYTYPNRSSVTLLEMPVNMLRQGRELLPLSPEGTPLKGPSTALLRVLDDMAPRPPDGVHLVVFVHGFRGTRFDFRLFRNYMAMLTGKSRMDYLLCQSLEQHAYQSLGLMGETLANEIQGHIETERLRVRKLSFVAHSMGAVVVRAALQHPRLEPYLPYLETYASFGAPHLGNTVVRSKVVDSAMWVLSAVKNAACIQQLKLADGFLHTLSCEDKLGRFHNVVLVACDEDTFVDQESALVLVRTDRASPERDPKAQQVEDMARNLRQHLTATDCWLRVRITATEGDVAHARQTVMERFTGKGHHVAFLCNVSFIIAFLSLYRDFFT